MDFSLRLKELREREKLTQTQFAKIFNIGIATIGMWESSQRKPPAKMLLKIANYFNVSIDYLLGREKTDNKTSSENTEDVNEWIEAFKEAGLKPEQFKSLSNDDRQLIAGLVKKFFNDDGSNK